MTNWIAESATYARKAARSLRGAEDRRRYGKWYWGRDGGYAETGMRRGLDLSPFGSVTSSTPLTRRAEI
jgi:hypothetical protein